jgi:hypothetical protein
MKELIDKACPECNKHIIVRNNAPSQRFGKNVLTHVTLLKFEDRLPLRKTVSSLERHYNLTLTNVEVLKITNRVANKLEILEERYEGVVCCDGWTAYTTYSNNLQRCCAHLLREAKEFAEKYSIFVGFYEAFKLIFKNNGNNNFSYCNFEKKRTAFVYYYEILFVGVSRYFTKKCFYNQKFPLVFNSRKNDNQ